MAHDIDIYGGKKPIDVPAYTPALVAHHLRLPIGNVRYWSLGRDHHKPVILIADPAARLLSFRNLIEIHVLSAVTRKYGVKLPAVRKAVEYLREQFGMTNPLSDEVMKTDGTSLFVERFGELINASKSGQVAIESLMRAHLRRVQRDESGLPVRLFPFTRAKPEGPESVMIDPRIQFGRPCITGTGVPTKIVADRFNAGESPDSLAEDFGRPRSDIEEAIRYETPGRAA
jgi:uncharacterized protein (DUF433 family)